VALPLAFFTLGSGIKGLPLATVLLGVSFSLVPAVLWPAVARYVGAEQLGTAYGLMTVLQQAGLLVANVAVGYANDASGASTDNPAGYDTMLWMFGVTSLVGCIFAALLAWRERVRRAVGVG
jgi:MFS family permease